jgi:hypothetical protein
VLEALTPTPCPQHWQVLKNSPEICCSFFR